MSKVDEFTAWRAVGRWEDREGKAGALCWAVDDPGERSQRESFQRRSWRARTMWERRIRARGRERAARWESCIVPLDLRRLGYLFSMVRAGRVQGEVYNEPEYLGIRRTKTSSLSGSIGNVPLVPTYLPDAEHHPTPGPVSALKGEYA